MLNLRHIIEWPLSYYQGDILSSHTATLWPQLDKWAPLLSSNESTCSCPAFADVSYGTLALRAAAAACRLSHQWRNYWYLASSCELPQRCWHVWGLLLAAPLSLLGGLVASFSIYASCQMQTLTHALCVLGGVCWYLLHTGNMCTCILRRIRPLTQCRSV